MIKMVTLAKLQQLSRIRSITLHNVSWSSFFLALCVCHSLHTFLHPFIFLFIPMAFALHFFVSLDFISVPNIPEFPLLRVLYFINAFEGVSLTKINESNIKNLFITISSTDE